MYAKIVLLAMVMAVVAATKGGRNCASGSKRFKVTKLEIDGCPKTPCTFTIGNSYNIDFTAVSNSVTNTLPYSLTVRILGQDIPLQNGNACDDLIQGECPTSVGGKFAFRLTLDVTIKYPLLETTSKAIVRDTAGNVKICFEFDIKIINNA